MVRTASRTVRPRIAAWRARRRNNRQARRGSDGKLCSPYAIIAPPLDGKKKYTQIIVSGRSALPGIGVVLLKDERGGRQRSAVQRALIWPLRAAVGEIEEFKVKASCRNGVFTTSVRAQRQAKRIAIYTR